jgi:multiple sugar transport system ATP-binding protein
MNMVDAKLVRDDGRLFADFGSTRLRLGDRIVSERPAIRAFEGRRVIAGIRPESMEDAAIVPEVPADRRMAATVTLREALGSEVLVHFPVDAPPVLTEDTRELVRDTGAAIEELEGSIESGTSVFVARLDPRTGTSEGHRLDLYVDTDRLHFFDPDTGLGIYADPPG